MGSGLDPELFSLDRNQTIKYGILCDKFSTFTYKNDVNLDCYLLDKKVDTGSGTVSELAKPGSGRIRNHGKARKYLEYDGPKGSPIQFPILVEDTQSKLLPGK